MVSRTELETQINAITDELRWHEGTGFKNTAKSASYVIYTPKWHAADKLVENGRGPKNTVDVVFAYGIPPVPHLQTLHSILGERPTFFLGDCDPFHLLLFAWLRKSVSIEYLGISDRVLKGLGTAIEDRNTIPLPTDEQLALKLLKDVNPDFVQLIGPECGKMLSNGRKLELEGAINYATITPHDVFDILAT